ncbi:CopG family transcriptional regulator [Sphingomonas colocasiae]|uniref:CopG family transcriptional regulator n=1 Tax=Sphingomonas colocasiae TaxID=1848973 RepID=A0ABS7PPL2_9SPHN|nr:CopG family transcriptional regulator [Sphingomonas colocasiae]MBY8823198.1 CopG family transcriptional regulator [Sphingomonas colocasiae]
MAGKVRHQLFLPRATSDRLEALASRPGVSKSALLAEAVSAWLDRRGRSELDDRFGLRLDRMIELLDRLARDSHIQLETLALFIRYELAINPPLAPDDHAGRAVAAKRFEAFLLQVARQVSAGQRSLEPGEAG